MTDLDNLAGLAHEADTDKTAPLPPGEAAPEDVPHVPGPEEQALDLVNMFAGTLAAYAPDAGAVWTEQARAMSAAAIAPVMVKYNWSMTAIPCELGAAIIVGPLLYRSAMIVGEKLKADRAAKAPAAATAQAPAAGRLVPAPGATETGAGPEVAVHPQMALYA
ncbi:MAG TPA: hypothetical protein VF800_11715 [Telluria sp.]|jgi:hypothetical protein